VWFGDELTPIQRLSIKSYIDNGHEFHLYKQELKGIPEGTVVHDTREIITDDELEKFGEDVVHAADFFRALVIFKEGGWYVDLDTICLKHFDFPEPYVFSSEDTSKFGNKKDPTGCPTAVLEQPTEYVGGCTFKCPPRSPFLECIIDRINGLDKRNIAWTASGPDLFSSLIPAHGLKEFVKAPVVFDAINPDELRYFVMGNTNWGFSEKSYAMHVRTSWWNSCYCPDGNLSQYHHPNSLYEQLKKKHGI